MVGEFFIRFNLHNSVCNYPACFDVLRPLVDISDAELQAFLDKIEGMIKSKNVSKADETENVTVDSIVE